MKTRHSPVGSVGAYGQSVPFHGFFLKVFKLIIDLINMIKPMKIVKPHLLEIIKLERTEQGLFLPNSPKKETLTIESAVINSVEINDIKDYLDANYARRNFPFGMILNLRGKKIPFITEFRIPHPEDMVYFLKLAESRWQLINDGDWRGLKKQKVNLHYIPSNQVPTYVPSKNVYGITFLDKL